MEDFISFFLILIVITILYIHLEAKSLEVKYIKSNIDNNVYLVRNEPNKQIAANILANIRKNLTKIVEHLKNKNQTNNNSEKYEAINFLLKNYRPQNISESSPNNKYTSYSINKGEKIVFCLRSKNTNKIENMNILLFVAIHELAHLMTKEVGHPPEFWDNMKYLLKTAKKIGINVKTDYYKNPVTYCGTKITDSPLK